MPPTVNSGKRVNRHCFWRDGRILSVLSAYVSLSQGLPNAFLLGSREAPPAYPRASGGASPWCEQGPQGRDRGVTITGDNKNPCTLQFRHMNPSGKSLNLPYSINRPFHPEAVKPTAAAAPIIPSLVPPWPDRWEFDAASMASFWVTTLAVHVRPKAISPARMYPPHMPHILLDHFPLRHDASRAYGPSSKD